MLVSKFNRGKHMVYVSHYQSTSFLVPVLEISVFEIYGILYCKFIEF